MTIATPAVLLDTDVFSAIYVTGRDVALKQGHPVDKWITQLEGCRVLISFQTRAELLAGALGAGWKARLSSLRERLKSTPTIGVDMSVVEAYAELTAACRSAGHPLHQKLHVADRWVAACAIAKGIPLLARDRIYKDAPGLDLFGRET